MNFVVKIFDKQLRELYYGYIVDNVDKEKFIGIDLLSVELILISNEQFVRVHGNTLDMILLMLC